MTFYDNKYYKPRLDAFCGTSPGSTSFLIFILQDAHFKWFKPSSKIFYWPFQGGTSFVDLLCVFFCLVFAMPLCASVYMCLVATCLERTVLLALVCGVYIVTVSLLLSHWYSGSGVVLDCVDSWYLHPYLL